MNAGWPPESSGPPGPHLGAALSAYLDGELAPAGRREAEAHLAACPSCQEELAEVGFVRARLRDMPVRAGSLAASGPARRSGRRAAWAAVAAAAAVIAVLLPQERDVAPAVPRLVDAHATRASVSGDPLTQLAPIAVPAGFRP